MFLEKASAVILLSEIALIDYSRWSDEIIVVLKGNSKPLEIPATYDEYIQIKKQFKDFITNPSEPKELK